MIQNVTIILWAKQGCPYCQEVKNYLGSKHLQYQEIDVTEQDALRDILETKYHVRHVPVVELGRPGSTAYEGVIKVGIPYLKEQLTNYIEGVNV